MPRLEDDLAASFRQGVHLAQRNSAVSPEALVFGCASSPGAVCFPLAALWVKRHMWHRGEGPAGRAAHLASESTMLAALAAHREASGGVCVAPPPGAPWDNYLVRVLGSSGLEWAPRPLDGLRAEGCGLERQVAGLLASLIRSQSYHFLCIQGGTPAQGHAMASYSASTAPQGLPLLHLFHPNWGEFKVSARHAPQFLARLLAWYDGHREFGPLTQVSLGRLRLRA